MTRLLYIARYRDATMTRKARWLADAGGFQVRLVCPRAWRDNLVQARMPAEGHLGFEQAPVPLLGRAHDPHRVLYGTADFGIPGFTPDVVYAEEEPDSLAALQIAWARRLFAPRAPLTFHTWQNVDRPRAPGVEWVFQQTLSAADGVLCANQAAEDILRRRGYRGRTAIIPAVGVDTTVFTPGPTDRRESAFCASFFGRLAPEKGLDLLLRAAARVGCPVRLVGDGPQRADLQALAARLGAQAEFVPPVPPAQVAAALREMDVLVLPSRSTPVWQEQFGRVLAEAMACGVPVIGARSGAIPEVIGDAGLLFDEGDVDGLADCLIRLKASPALRNELAQRGLARATTRYSQTVLAQQVGDFLRELLP